jgi:hypothetical protein
MVGTDKVRNEALQIITTHISEASICLMTNNILDWPLQSESLNNQWLDGSGNIWFLSFRHDNSSSLNGKMEVFYSNRSKARFLSLVGVAEEASWSDVMNIAEFPFQRHANHDLQTPAGLVRFFPQEAYFWDDAVKDMVPLMLFDRASTDNDNRKMVA